MKNKRFCGECTKIMECWTSEEKLMEGRNFPACGCKFDPVEVVYFELNDIESNNQNASINPFWNFLENEWKIEILDDLCVYKHELCVVGRNVGDIHDYCITAKMDWVLKHCPKLLTKHRDCLRFPDEHGFVFGKYGQKFKPYTSENIGIHFEKISK